jgi:DNA-directed RNA polymerase specialized sigma24 family protein
VSHNSSAHSHTETLYSKRLLRNLPLFGSRLQRGLAIASRNRPFLRRHNGPEIVLDPLSRLVPPVSPPAHRALQPTQRNRPRRRIHHQRLQHIDRRRMVQMSRQPHQQPTWNPASSDDTLVAAALCGEREAFGAIYDRYLARVFGYCKRMLSDAEAAEDVNSIVFLRALSSLARYRSRSTDDSFRIWLFAIAHHAIVDELRSRGRTDPLETARFAGCAPSFAVSGPAFRDRSAPEWTHRSRHWGGIGETAQRDRRPSASWVAPAQAARGHELGAVSDGRRQRR